MGTSWKSYRELIVDELKNHQQTGKPKELYNPIDYILSLGGKRIRPVLCLMAAELFGAESKKALPLALGIEIFHNFTLVHDDIMDEAPLRRGKSTVHEKWNRDIAILSGDVMFVKAYEFICKAEPKQLPSLLKLFNQTAIEVCEGQQLDMNFELETKVEIADYIEMIRLKTAVLLACSLKMGAIAAGASAKDADLIYSFGINIGIAFQIQDDYLDCYADQADFGKRVGGDIISNKKTYLLLSAMDKGTPEQQSALNKLMTGESDETQKVKQVLELYNQIGVPALTKTAMERYFKLGMNAISEISADEALKQPLIELAEMLMNRKE
ncbi:MAG: polyprenyl synthetase family protein [Vicingaceae bacterium]